MKWYFPSHAGDFRLEPLDPAADYRGAPKDRGQACLLRVIDPTAGERVLLERFLKGAAKKGWTDVLAVAPEKHGDQLVQVILLQAPLPKAGASLLKYVRPSKSTLTALSYNDGRVVTTKGTSDTAVAELEAEIEKTVEAPVEEQPKAAASVSRPTPCCPACEPGSIAPAREVLLSFLTPEQHADWARHRAFRVRGHASGHDYLVMHRNSHEAAINGKCCYDLTDEARMDFHDVSVPPEEEALAVKLILEHAEPWLRNEATCLPWRGSGPGPGVYGFRNPGGHSAYAGPRRNVFKNPFGGIGDGTESSGALVALGTTLHAVARGLRG